MKVIDFFCGCGGTSAGFQAAGLEIAGGLDLDPSAAKTFRRNFPNAGFIEGDITDVDPSEVDRMVGGGPVLFAGCAPCQPFSKQNRQKRTDDSRRPLLAEFGRFVLALRPEFVVVENVPGLQRIGDAGPFPAFRSQLQDLGYSVAAAVLKASDFGVPQTRRRLVLVASLKGPACLPKARGGSPPSVRDAIGGLPRLEAGEVDCKDPDHAAMRLSPRNLQRIRLTAEGGGRETWPHHLLAPCHREHQGHSDTYGRMSWDRPASGLTTRCLSYSNGRFGHPDQDRAISAREAALLQTFPANFRFEGTLGAKGIQIGNAVPPLFAQQIAEALLAG
jgi:DNA (cytosine-5)-methyltransferase 1